MKIINICKIDLEKQFLKKKVIVILLNGEKTIGLFDRVIASASDVALPDSVVIIPAGLTYDENTKSKIIKTISVSDIDEIIDEIK